MPNPQSSAEPFDAAHFRAKLVACAANSATLGRNACATVAGIIELAREAPESWRQACKDNVPKIRPSSQNKHELVIAKYIFGKDRRQSSRYAAAAKFMADTRHEGDALIASIQENGGVEGCVARCRADNGLPGGVRGASLAAQLKSKVTGPGRWLIRFELDATGKLTIRQAEIVPPVEAAGPVPPASEPTPDTEEEP